MLNDSEQLSTYQSGVLSNRNQLLNSLELKYNRLLELQDYAVKESGGDIFTLQAEMKKMAPKYQQVDDKIFANQKFQDLKAESLQYLAATDKLGTYQKQVVENPETVFPYGAAKIFYDKTIKAFNEQITGAESVKALDTIAEEMQPLTEPLPADFELLSDTQAELGNAYI